MADNVPHPIDLQVGARIRLRRKGMGMTQKALADAMGVTFQQVQKYEVGVSRISASRLHDVAAVLQTRIGYFFDNRDGGGEDQVQADAGVLEINDFLATKEGLDFARVLPKLPRTVRRHMLAMAQSIAGLQTVR